VEALPWTEEMRHDETVQRLPTAGRRPRPHRGRDRGTRRCSGRPTAAPTQAAEIVGEDRPDLVEG
jgi:hypothetical protein